MAENAPRIAIADYGMGNLHNVQRACAHVGLDAWITTDPDEVAGADGVILPGVGAFRDAMRALDAGGLADALRATAAEGRPLLGICLGMQLLMGESYEFGTHRGLGIVDGTVERLTGRDAAGAPVKVPQVGWNRVDEVAPGAWEGTLLEGLPDGVSMYFVHSYRVRVADPGAVLSTTRYGVDEFCSTLRAGSVLGCQYHPELSSERGLDIYRRFALQAGVAPIASEG